MAEQVAGGIRNGASPRSTAPGRQSDAGYEVAPRTPVAAFLPSLSIFPPSIFAARVDTSTWIHLRKSSR